MANQEARRDGSPPLIASLIILRSRMKPVPTGAQGSYEFTVSREDLAGTVEPSLPLVLATAKMSLAMELAAINALSPYLEPGEFSVGVTVNVTHTAATPEGWKVRAEAEVTGGE